METKLRKLDKIDKIEEQVAVNMERVEHHEVAIGYNVGAIKEVMSRLEAFKISTDLQAHRAEEQHSMFIAKIEEPNSLILTELRKEKEINAGPKPPTDKFPPLAHESKGSKDEHEKTNRRNRGWEKDHLPVGDDELDQLVDRSDPVRRMTDHNLAGLKLLYFVREKQGNIGMVRNYIERRQLQLGRVIKGPNFIEYEKNEVTEVVALAKLEKATIVANEALIASHKKHKKKRNILGEQLPDVNPYLPRWEGGEITSS